MSIVEQFPSDGVFCVFVFFGGFVGAKRVSKLSRRYHLHKKQLRQSAMMTEGLSDATAAAEEKRIRN